MKAGRGFRRPISVTEFGLRPCQDIVFFRLSGFSVIANWAATVFFARESVGGENYLIKLINNLLNKYINLF
jgi:hypothetical protein